MLIAGRKMYAAAILILGLSTQAQATKMDHAILSIGQEMASMRNALGLYCMVGMKIKYKDPFERIRSAGEHYEKTLSQIKADYGDAAIQEKIKTSEEAWVKMKPKLIAADADEATLKNNALFIHANVRSVLKGLTEIKSIILEGAKSKKNTYLNAAIEIGASSKRLSAHYLMKIWKLDDPTIDEHWKAGVKRYKGAIALLKESSYYGDADFKGKVDKCEKELQFFEMMYSMSKGAPTIIDNKTNAVEKLSQEMVTTIQNSK